MARLASIALLLAALTGTSAYAAYDADAGNVAYPTTDDVSVMGSDGWYFSVAAGVAKSSGNIETVAPIVQDGFVRLAEINNSDYKIGWDAAVAIGYKSGPVRYEGEFTYIENNIKDYDIDGVEVISSGGNTRDAVGLLNLYYDFDDTGMSIVPYIGAGLGILNTRVGIDGFVADAFGFTDPVTFDIKENLFAYQGTLGLLFNLNNNSSVSLAYRYLGSTSGKTLGERAQIQMINLGFFYRFDQT